MRKYGPIIWGALNIQLNSTSREKIVYQLQTDSFLSFLPETTIDVGTRQNVFLTIQQQQQQPSLLVPSKLG
jgi:hypothetical protein